MTVRATTLTTILLFGSLIVSWLILIPLLESNNNKRDCSSSSSSSFSFRSSSYTAATVTTKPANTTTPTNTTTITIIDGGGGGNTVDADVVVGVEEEVVVDDVMDHFLSNVVGAMERTTPPWSIPGEMNRLRRYMAINEPQNYETYYKEFFEKKFRRRLSTVKKHLMLHEPKAGGTSVCKIAKNHFRTKGGNCWSDYFIPIWCCGNLKGDMSQTRILRDGRDCSLMDHDFPEFTMNENWLDHPLCMEHRLYSINIREPISRAMSHEKHLWHFKWKQKFNKRKKEKPYGFYLDERLTLARNNYMTWSLSAGRIARHKLSNYWNGNSNSNSNYYNINTTGSSSSSSSSSNSINSTTTTNNNNVLNYDLISDVPNRITHLAIAKDALSRMDFIWDVIELTKTNKPCEKSILKLIGFPPDKVTTVPHANDNTKWNKSGRRYEAKLPFDRYAELNSLDVELYQLANEFIKVDCEFFVRLTSNNNK